MVMQRPGSRSTPPPNGLLIALAVGILLLGAGFLFAYDSLRSSNVVSGSAQEAERSSGEYVPRTDDRALIEMGIDPEDNDLSPAALAAIARAHRAAQDAGGAAETDSDEPAGPGGEGAADETLGNGDRASAAEQTE